MSKLSELETKLEKYRDKLEFIQEADRLVIRCVKYIHDKNEWSEIDSIIRGEGGRYVAKDKGGPEWRVKTEVPAKTLGEIHREQEKPKTTESFGTIRCPYCNKVINFKVGSA